MKETEQNRPRKGAGSTLLSIELATASFLGTREKSWTLDEKTKEIKAQSHRRSQNLTSDSRQ